MAPVVPHRWTVLPSPVGDLLLTSSPAGLSGLYMSPVEEAPVVRDLSRRTTDTGLFAEVRDQLADYWSGSPTVFDLPLDLQGTPFQRSVWTALQTIAYGTTSTYGALARQLGSPGAARAVGLANGRNKISLIVPCHRVVGSSGTLTGYAGGLDRKRWLLAHESTASDPTGPVVTTSAATSVTARF